MTQLTKDTPLPDRLVLDVPRRTRRRPDLLVFTIVIQNSVPFRQMGVATSNLTFFRQIGGSVALAFVGTIFATAFQNDFVPAAHAGRRLARHAGPDRGGAEGRPVRPRQRYGRGQPP
jgi:hypothetical protein